MSRGPRMLIWLAIQISLRCIKTSVWSVDTAVVDGVAPGDGVERGLTAVTGGVDSAFGLGAVSRYEVWRVMRCI